MRFSSAASVVLAFVLLSLPLFTFTRVNTRVYTAPTNTSTNLLSNLTNPFAPAKASALASDNLNFQARLASAGGAIVQDGYYNVEFKLYSASTGGTALWTETHAYNSGAGTCSGPVGTNDCRIRVVNGYVSVYLGSVTSFPNTIPWDQQLYLTMNVGGTTSAGAITYDGEMTPRLKLTAVPYAMEAKKASQLTSSNGALISNLSITAPTVGNQNFVIQDQGAAGTYNVLLEESAATVLGDDFIQNQNTAQQATSNFWISGTARSDTSVQTPLIDTATAVALNIGTTNATTINLNQSTTLAAGKSITITGGATGTRPASPTEGMIYFDTTTKQLLTYANAKWQADSKTAVFIVAASDSTQADKDGAQYVANGEDSAGAGIGTLDGDQVQINAALTAAGAAKGGTVYLAPGTYTIDAGISIPNNVTLAGSGASTLIRLGNFGATSVNISMITNTDTATGTRVGVRDLRLDGYRSINTAGTQYGILFNNMGAGSGASARAGGKITNVYIANTKNFGLYISTSSNNTITGNTVLNSGTDGIVLFSSNYNVISGNITQGNTSDGLVLNTAANNTITSNIMQGNGDSGIFLSTATNNTITGNTLNDNEGATFNNAIYLSASDGNTITSNDITDTSATTDNYAINISDATSDNNYLADNRFSSTPGTSNIRDLGTGTVYANQPTAENGMNLLNRSLNSTTAFSVQGTNKVNVFNVDTTNGEIELGAPTLAGKLVISDGSSNTVTLSVGALAGDYTLGIPTMTANDTLCLVTAANCANGTMFIQNQNASQQTANYWVSGAARADTSVLTPSLDRATAGTLSIGTNGTNTTAITIGNATAATSIVSNTTNLGTDGGTIVLQATSGAAGNGLTIKGGAATSGNTNGGILTLSGGAGNGSGVMGLVNLSPTAFTAVGSTQSFSGSGSLTAGLVDTYSTITVTSTGAGVVVTIPAPATGNQTVGRVLYIAAANGSNDFGILLAGTSINIAMKANSTATLIWNGTGWTAAGASSSTDLQSAYNNTLTSAGGAELILNASGGAADGLTIRNNGTTPITGGILEVQSSIGTNLFSVNSLGTELAANGGAETSSTFATNWTAAPAGGTVSRTTTSGQYETGQAGAQVVTTATQYHGIRNNLSANPVASTTYQVSFTAKSTTANTPIDVIYSPDGGTTPIACTTYGGQTLSNTIWTKITCTITTTAAAVTNPDLIIRQTDTTARTIYVDNLSFMRNDSTTQPSNVQIGGGITGGQITLFTLDRSSAPPVANGDTTYYGSMYYDTTTGRIQCYESDGWGACGSAPDNIVVLTPEYSNAVLGAPGMLGGVPTATGVGTLTADFCSNQSGVLQVNTGFCASGISRNYYRWTSPQATSQTYSIYVSYKLPSTFKQFYDNDTVKLTALKDHATNAGASLSVFRSTGGAVTQCGSTTTITTSTSSWVTTSLIGNETSCNFTGGDVILFKIDVSANSNSSVYIENLEFRYTNV